MRAEEIREMSDADIRTRIGEMEEERFRLKFRSATETLEDPLRLRTRMFVCRYTCSAASD